MIPYLVIASLWGCIAILVFKELQDLWSYTFDNALVGTILALVAVVGLSILPIVFFAIRVATGKTLP